MRLFQDRCGRKSRRNYALEDHGFSIEQVLWVDEHSQKVRYMPVGDWQTLFPVGLNESGETVYDELVPRIKPKFRQSAAGVFGVAIIDGVGTKMVPMRYLNTVIGPRSWERERVLERDRVKSMRRPPSNWEILVCNDVWIDERIHRLRKKFDVRRLIKHVIEEGNRMFRDTQFTHCWLIYHDYLKSWWELGCQQYMLELRFDPRRCLGCGSSPACPQRYRNKTVGDSPELMPLDSYLFADFKIAVLKNAVFKPDEYKVGTPNALWETMTKVWGKIPRSDRVLADIRRWPTTVSKIIAQEGAYVEDKSSRQGNRAVLERIHRTTRARMDWFIQDAVQDLDDANEDPGC